MGGVESGERGDATQSGAMICLEEVRRAVVAGCWYTTTNRSCCILRRISSFPFIVVERHDYISYVYTRRYDIFYLVYQ